jgi:lyso-ornithine lipid O-acyltransferase
MTRILKFALLLIWILACFLPGWLALRFKKTALRDRLARICYAGILKIIGVHLSVRGELSPVRPLLLVSNHLSYLDIFVLGSVFPFRFTPKAEISSWPGISTLCRVTGAVFVDRRPEMLTQSSDAVKSALATGQVVCLFPESTTGSGVSLKPFKSGMFQLAAEGISVQPAAIVYTRLRKLPIDYGQWPLIAWYGDMDLVPHLWTLLALGRIDAEVVLLPAVSADGRDRKAIAAQCQNLIAGAIEEIRNEVRTRPVQNRKSWLDWSRFRSKS